METYQSAGIVQDSNQVLYALSNVVNVIRSTDDGMTWEPANDGLPAAIPTALLHSSKGKIFVGFQFGRVYRMAAPATVSDQANTIKITRYGSAFTISNLEAHSRATLVDILGRTIATAEGFPQLTLPVPTGVQSYGVLRVQSARGSWTIKVVLD